MSKSMFQTAAAYIVAAAVLALLMAHSSCSDVVVDAKGMEDTGLADTVTITVTDTVVIDTLTITDTVVIDTLTITDTVVIDTLTITDTVVIDTLAIRDTVVIDTLVVTDTVVIDTVTIRDTIVVPPNVFEIARQTSVIESNTVIVFEFSENIDRIRATSKTVEMIGNNLPLYDVLWSENTMTVTPIGEWREDVTLKFTDVLYSVGGKSLDLRAQDYFLPNLNVVDLSNTRVTGLRTAEPLDKFNVYSTSVTLTWNRVEGATYYQVYLKRNDRNYVSIYDNITDTSIYGAINRQGYANVYMGDSVYTFIVQAHNSRSKSRLEGSDSVVIKPYLTLRSDYYLKQTQNDTTLSFLDNILYENGEITTYKESLEAALRSDWPDAAYNITHYVDFSEPIDTSGISITTSMIYGRLAITQLLWFSDLTAFVMYISVTNGPAITTTLDVTYTIAGIKNQSGRELTVGYDVNGERIIKNTLDIRFVLTP